MYEWFTISNTKCYLDGGYSKHMTEDKSMLYSFTHIKEGFVSYGDNNKGNIIGIGSVGKFLNPTIWEVLLIYGLKHNWLSISQLCEKGNSVIFDSSRCKVVKPKSCQTIFTISRSGNIYVVNLNNIPSNDVYILSNKDESWLWHTRLTHIHMDHLNKLVYKNLLIGLSNLHFKKSRLCGVCQKGK